jgi:hypothetical protein
MKNSPRGRGRNKIFSNAPEVQALHGYGLSPGHGPRLGRANQDGQGMSHLGQLSGKKIEIDPLAAAIGIPAVREEANFHLSTLFMTI